MRVRIPKEPQASLVWIPVTNSIPTVAYGDLMLIRLNPNGYVEETRANIIGRTWAHPAYAGNCVYARSDTEIVCVLLPLKSAQSNQGQTDPGYSVIE